MEIQGSKAIFVGGASGMCRATAERFKQGGGEVAILDLEASNGADDSSVSGRQVLPLQCDGLCQYGPNDRRRCR